MARVRVIAEFASGFSTAYVQHQVGDVLDVEDMQADRWFDAGHVEIVPVEAVPVVEVPLVAPVAEVVMHGRPAVGLSKVKKGR